MLKTTAAVALSAALTLGSAGAANAELYGIDDPQETGHGSDVLALSVRNAPKNLSVTTYHVNLRHSPRSGTSAEIFIDTDRSDQGPEYVFVGGYYQGTDYVLLHTEGFKKKTWGQPVENGDYVLRLDYKKERARVIMSRAAIGNAGKVRVAVRVSGTRSDGTSHGLVDWVGKPRSFTPWLDRG